MEITFWEKANRKEQEAITTGIIFDLKILLSTIKGKTILMMNRAYSNHYYQSDFNEIVSLVEESIIRAEFIPIPVADIKNLVCKPVLRLTDRECLQSSLPRALPAWALHRATLYISL